MGPATDEPKKPTEATGEDVRTPSSDHEDSSVRKQLKETSIDTANDAADSASIGSGTEQSGGRKRSFEESRDKNEETDSSEGPRKRSREATPQTAKDTEGKNVSDATPKDPEGATPPELATDESSHGIPDHPEIEYYNIVSSDESERSLLFVEQTSREASPEVIVISSDSESEIATEHWIESVEAAGAEEVFDLGSEDSESVETIGSPSGAVFRERSLDSVEKEWLEDFKPSPESSPESSLSSEARTDRPTDFPAESPSCGQDTHLSKNDNTNTTSQDTTEPKDSTNTMKDDGVKALNKKRSLEQVEDEGAKKPEETENKRHRDNSQEREAQKANAFAQSAFGSAVSSSPFASLCSSKPATTTTSSASEQPASKSAFASSALGSFAGSETSPFGSFGSSKPSVFQSSTGTSAFGSTSKSGFGSLKNVFAGVGGGFAAAAKTGGLSNFASPDAAATLGGDTKSSASKPIGADDSEGDGSDNEEGEGTNTFGADKTDERFYEQKMSTGEEEEENIFSCKGKLFHFSGEWKERGVGTFKVNVRRDDKGKQHGRMIMRADGALRVMLNSPVFKGMTCGDAKNQEPSSKQIFLASIEEGRTVPLLLRVGNENIAKDLYGVIKNLLDDDDDNK
ncbi:Uncharacterized protein PECH_008210 [Penicillium ucsense]|uniref:RanBD1 domain-containing protein n=1 Tax=Penicillium ucsense TaxID=2839758 RepID=A0A8J8W582_9EURO|nr:Uncharacterized protein PECM_005273 [Penicillium ucsense]KAF7734337.1 Uncharacterized protein PECH_008210 [Penicillium ucsense]